MTMSKNTTPKISKQLRANSTMNGAPAKDNVLSATVVVTVPMILLPEATLQ